MSPSERDDALIEAALTAYRDRDADGLPLSHPAWADLTPEAREEAFYRQLAARRLGQLVGRQVERAAVLARVVAREVARHADREAQRRVLAGEARAAVLRVQPHAQQRLLHDALGVDRARERFQAAADGALDAPHPLRKRRLVSAADPAP